MKKLLLILGFTAFLASCRDIKDPVFKNVENVKGDKLSFTNTAVTLDMRYYNPNNFKGQLKQAEGDAWMDSTYLGHFVVDTVVNIHANSDFLVPVKLAVDMKQVLKHSLTALFNDEVNIRITGKAKAGKGGFFRNFNLNYQGKQNLRELFK